MTVSMANKVDVFSCVFHYEPAILNHLRELFWAPAVRYEDVVPSVVSEGRKQRLPPNSNPNNATKDQFSERARSDVRPVVGAGVGSDSNEPLTQIAGSGMET